MKRLTEFVCCCAAALAATGCFGYERKSTLTGPSASGISALVGSWSSSNIIPSASACTDFKWNVTEQTSTSAKGSFSATCAGELKVSGTAEGTLNGTGGISWNAAGNASAPGLPSCTIVLTGTAELGVDSVRVPYSGNTCLGEVSGVEILRRN
jgi:hypothetical protein